MATCATMSLRAVRPCLAKGRFITRQPELIFRIQPRLLHTRCQAKAPGAGEGSGSEDQQQNKQLQRQEGRGHGLSPRPSYDLMSPEATFRRMSDYMDNLQREMESMIDVFGMRPSVFGTSPFSLASSMLDTPMMSNLRSMALNVQETDNEYKINADVPGFSKDNIKVTVTDDGVLTIEGHEAEEQQQEGATSRRSRNFMRRVQLPDHVDRDGIAARVENGVLSLTLPKAAKPEPPAPKQIPIN